MHWPGNLGLMQVMTSTFAARRCRPGLTPGSGRKQRYREHLSHEELGQGLKRGSLFRAPFRVNAHDRTQAFATVPGLPSDLMIRVRLRLWLPDAPYSAGADGSRAFRRNMPMPRPACGCQTAMRVCPYLCHHLSLKGGLLACPAPVSGTSGYQIATRASCHCGQLAMLMSNRAATQAATCCVRFCVQGLSMQNRAVEGDEVALHILPPAQWFISGQILQV